MATNRRIVMTGVVMAVSFMMLFATLAVTTGASAATTDRTSQITTEVGPTSDLGGGDHFLVKFGSDAAFGILWGNETNHNNIYFVSYVSRYLGYINVDYPNGSVISKQPLKIYTLYAVQLDRLIEYNDSDGNGVLSYSPFAGTVFSDLLGLGHEQIYKGVNLDTAWTGSNWQNGTEVNGNLTWSFTLTATNLSYSYNPRYDASKDMSGDNMLNSISLTFHLTASTKHEDNLAIPQWNVTMTRGLFGQPKFSDLDRSNDLNVSGNVTNYQVKWSKDIEGWDFDSQDANPTIMAEYHVLVVNYIPPRVTGLMALAECQKMIAATGDNGTMTADNGALDGSSNIAAFSLHTPRLTFGGPTTRIGLFEWVQNCTVDGRTENATGQVTALMPFNVHYRGNEFYGFIASVGISYPGGSSIVQDPDISSQALTDVALSTNSGGGGGEARSPFSGLAIGLMLVVVVAVVLAILIASRRKGGKGPELYEKKTEPKSEWSDYYEKK